MSQSSIHHFLLGRRASHDVFFMFFNEKMPDDFPDNPICTWPEARYSGCWTCSKVLLKQNTIDPVKQGIWPKNLIFGENMESEGGKQFLDSAISELYSELNYKIL